MVFDPLLTAETTDEFNKQEFNPSGAESNMKEPCPGFLH